MRKELPYVVAAVIAALLAVPSTYSLLRAVEVMTHPDPGPAMGVWSPTVALFRRAGVGAFVAGMVGPVVYLLARKSPAATMRVLSGGVVVVAAANAAQALLLP